WISRRPAHSRSPPFEPWRRVSGPALVQELRAFDGVGDPSSISARDHPLKLVDDPALAVLASRDVQHDDKHDGAEKGKARFQARYLIDDRRPCDESDQRPEI